MQKKIIGLIEKIKIKNQEVLAKMDTGADRNSIDSTLAAELKLGPIVKTTKVKSSHGSSLRPVIKTEIEIKGKKIKTTFSLTTRKHMKYRVLIGKKTLKGFLIDPEKE